MKAHRNALSLFLLFIFLLHYNLNPATAGSACINAKEREVKKRKGIEALRMKHPTRSRAADALIREEEQNRIQKGTKRKEIRK